MKNMTIMYNLKIKKEILLKICMYLPSLHLLVIWFYSITLTKKRQRESHQNNHLCIWAIFNMFWLKSKFKLNFLMDFTWKLCPRIEYPLLWCNSKEEANQKYSNFISMFINSCRLWIVQSLIFKSPNSKKEIKKHLLSRLFLLRFQCLGKLACSWESVFLQNKTVLDTFMPHILLRYKVSTEV